MVISYERGYSDKAYILPSCTRLHRLNCQTGPNLSQIAWVDRKIYQLFSIVSHLNLLKFAFSAPTPLFNAFTQDTISIKFQGNAEVLLKGIKAEM